MVEDFDFDDLIKLLLSPKVSEKSNGFKCCNDLIDKEIEGYQICNSKQWTKILKISISNEISEIDSYINKSKKTVASIETILRLNRKIIRHCINSHPHIIHTIFSKIVDHSLNIIKNFNYPDSIKSEHKKIIIDILCPTIFHWSGHETSVLDLYKYLVKSMIDNKSISENLHQKMVKALCKCISYGHSPELIDDIVKWFNVLLKNVIGDLVLSLDIVCLVCESTSVLISNNDINMLEILESKYSDVINGVLRVLINEYSSEPQKDICMQFLYDYLDVMIRCDVSILNKLSESNSISKYLVELWNLLTSEKLLKSILSHAYTQMNNSSTIYDQSKVRKYFVVSARILNLIERSCCLVESKKRPSSLISNNSAENCDICIDNHIINSYFSQLITKIDSIKYPSICSGNQTYLLHGYLLLVIYISTIDKNYEFMNDNINKFKSHLSNTNCFNTIISDNFIIYNNLILILIDVNQLLNSVKSKATEVYNFISSDDHYFYCTFYHTIKSLYKLILNIFKSYKTFISEMYKVNNSIVTQIKYNFNEIVNTTMLNRYIKQILDFCNDSKISSGNSSNFDLILNEIIEIVVILLYDDTNLCFDNTKYNIIDQYAKNVDYIEWGQNNVYSSCILYLFILIRNYQLTYKISSSAIILNQKNNMENILLTSFFTTLNHIIFTALDKDSIIHIQFSKYNWVPIKRNSDYLVKSTSLLVGVNFFKDNGVMNFYDEYDEIFLDNNVKFDLNHQINLFSKDISRNESRHLNDAKVAFNYDDLTLFSNKLLDIINNLNDNIQLRSLNMAEESRHRQSSPINIILFWLHNILAQLLHILLNFGDVSRFVQLPSLIKGFSNLFKMQLFHILKAGNINNQNQLTIFIYVINSLNCLFAQSEEYKILFTDYYSNWEIEIKVIFQNLFQSKYNIDSVDFDGSAMLKKFSNDSVPTRVVEIKNDYDIYSKSNDKIANIRSINQFFKINYNYKKLLFNLAKLCFFLSKYITISDFTQNVLNIPPAFQGQLSIDISFSIFFAAMSVKPSFDNFMYAIDSNWEKELGYYGYTKILQLFKKLINQVVYKNIPDEVNKLNDYLFILFAESIEKSSIHLLQNVSWICKYNQLSCLNDLYTYYNDIDNLKENIISLFTLCVKDNDIRILLTVNTVISNLFIIFKNHSKVYNNIKQLMIDSHYVFTNSSSQSICTRFFGTAICLVIMGFVSKELLVQSFSDIIHMQNHANNTDNNLLSGTVVLKCITNKLMICSNDMFFSDNIVFLIQLYLKYYVNDYVANNNPINEYIFKKFPFYLLSTNIVQYQSIILVTIGQCGITALRWELLTVLLNTLHIPIIESSINKYLLSFIYKIKAVELLNNISYLDVNFIYEHNKDIVNSKDNISSLISNCMSSSLVKKHSMDMIPDVVYEIFLSFTLIQNNHIHSKLSYSDIALDLRNVLSVLNTQLEKLLLDCNIICILSSLYLRSFTESNLSSKGVLACFYVILDSITETNFSHGIYESLKKCLLQWLYCHPLEIESGLEVLEKLVLTIVNFQFQQHSLDAYGLLYDVIIFYSIFTIDDQETIENDSNPIFNYIILQLSEFYDSLQQLSSNVSSQILIRMRNIIYNIFQFKSNDKIVLNIPHAYLTILPSEVKKTDLFDFQLINRDLSIDNLEKLVIRICNGDNVMISEVWHHVLSMKEQIFHDERCYEKLIQLCKYKSDKFNILISCMIEIMNHFIRIPILIREISYLLGMIGIADIYSIKHDILPYKQSKVSKYLHGDIVLTMRQIIRKLYGHLFNSLYRYSYSNINKVIKELGSNRCLEGLFASSHSIDNDNDFGLKMKIDYELMDLTKFYSIKQIIDDNNSISKFAIKSKLTSKISLKDDDCVWDSSTSSYDEWLCQLTTYLLNYLLTTNELTTENENVLVADEMKRFLCPFINITSIFPKLCESIFPLLIYTLLLCDGSKLEISNYLSKNIQKYGLFNQSNIIIIQLMCHTLIFLYRQNISLFLNNKKFLQHNEYFPFVFPLNLDPLKIANYALKSRLYCTAIFLVEIHYIYNKDNDTSLGNDILLESYIHNNDCDAIHGNVISTDLQVQSKLFSFQSQWGAALSNYECIAQSRNYERIDTIQKGINESLEGLGYYYLRDSLNQNNVNYESLDHIKEWNNFDDFLSTNSNYYKNNIEHANINYNNYMSILLSDLISPRKKYHKKYLNKLTSEILDELDSSIVSNMSFESSNHYVNQLIKFQNIIDIQEIKGVIQISLDNSINNNMISLLDKWNDRLSININNIKIVQSTINYRINILKELYLIDKINMIPVIHILNSLNVLLINKENAFAFSPLIYQLKAFIVNQAESTIEKSSSKNVAKDVEISMIEWTIYESKLLWLKGFDNFAVTNINNNVIKMIETKLINKPNNLDNHTYDILSESLRLVGEWMSIRRSSNALKIINEYLLPSVNYSKSNRQVLKSLSTISSFSFMIYDNIKNSMDSNEWEENRKIAESRERNYNFLKSLYLSLNKTNDKTKETEDQIKIIKKQIITIEKEIEYDKYEYNNILSSINEFLILSIKHYSKYLIISSKNDVDVIFQIINLWFNNYNNNDINILIYDLIDNILTFKFVPLCYQIFSRLGITNNQTTNQEKKKEKNIKKIDFPSSLNKLIFRLCSEHPYHTLPQLFALINEKQVEGYSGSINYLSNILDNNRNKVALKICSDLKTNTKLSKLIETMEVLLLSYIELAQTSTEAIQNTGKLNNISFNDISKKPFNITIKNLRFRPCVISISYPIQSNLDYSQIVKIINVIPTFSITETGLSRPKIIKCLGSDGNIYTQLVKGGDDMRQDAVMEQVFENVNHTFLENENTRKRQLSIRTYKIIPTSPQTGLLEWVENAKAFGSYLVNREDGGAHKKYYPDDWSNSKCREHIQFSNDKLNLYNQICENFHPVFRFYFIEKYSDPVKWLTCRLTYVRSIAVTSIIGYILGIGDRHTQNILIDSSSAEIIHIDFGIVFEQGRHLPIPEVVPFRLTRDVVDPMGVSGVEGTFRRCCEESLRLLRNNIMQLRTILEVVIHDPLYKWNLSPIQCRQRQVINKNKDSNDVIENFNNSNIQESNSYGLDSAKKTLIRIDKKLQGFENVTGQALSIEGQVGQLISEATDVNNLCKMFAGWAPWI